MDDNVTTVQNLDGEKPAPDEKPLTSLLAKPTAGQETKQPEPVSGAETDQITTPKEGADTETKIAETQPAAEAGEPAKITGEPKEGPERGKGAKVQTPEEKAARRAQVDALIDQYAEEQGVDAKDDTVRGLLSRVAHKELWIRELQAKAKQAVAEVAGQKPDRPAKPDEADLTEFERSILEADAQPESAKPGEGQGVAKPVAEPTPAPAAVAQDLAKFGDIGDGWKTEADAFEDLDKAYADRDLKKVAEIQNAIFTRQFAGMALPRVMAYVERTIKDRLDATMGDVVSEVRQTAEERRELANIRFAKKQVATIPEFADLQKMFEIDQEGALEFEGQTFESSPFNRIISRNPELLSLLEDPTTHEDLDTRDKLNRVRFYKCVARIWKREQQAQPAKPANGVKQLVEEAAKAQPKPSPDQVRQELNAGRTATGRPAGPKQESYVAMIRAPAGERPLSELIRR